MQKRATDPAAPLIFPLHVICVLIRWLIDNRYIYRDSRNKLNPYSTAKEKGLFQVKEYVSANSNHAGTQTLITPKGRDTFRMLMKL